MSVSLALCWCFCCFVVIAAQCGTVTTKKYQQAPRNTAQRGSGKEEEKQEAAGGGEEEQEQEGEAENGSGNVAQMGCNKKLHMRL